MVLSLKQLDRGGDDRGWRVPGPRCWHGPTGICLNGSTICGRKRSGRRARLRVAIVGMRPETTSFAHQESPSAAVFRHDHSGPGLE